MLLNSAVDWFTHPSTFQLIKAKLCASNTLSDQLELESLKYSSLMVNCLSISRVATYFWQSLVFECKTLEMVGPFKIWIRDYSALKDLISKCFCFEAFFKIKDRVTWYTAVQSLLAKWLGRHPKYSDNQTFGQRGELISWGLQWHGRNRGNGKIRYHRLW